MTHSLSRLLADPAARVAVAGRDASADTTCRIGEIRNEAGGGTVAEVFIYGAIHPMPWFDEVSAANFVGELAALDVDEISVRINSPGGDVYDALAITNALKSHPAKVTTIIEGLAASAASFIAQAGDTVIVRPNAEVMIHDPSMIARGNPAELADLAKWLDRAADNIADIYAQRAGGEPADWRAAMRAETWYSATEAVEAGLADESHSDSAGKSATTDDRTNEAAAAALAARYACRAQAPAPFMPTDLVGRQKGSDMALRQEIAARLGIAEDADENAILAKLDEITDLATKPNAVDAAAVTAFAEANGLRVIDAVKYGEIEDELTRRRADDTARVKADRATKVLDAVKAGKITPARRDHFVALMDADPDGTAAMLDSLPANLSVPTTELGSCPADETELSPYDELFGKPADDSKEA
ncbi:head maturation protease, ClpP-related [Gordonia sp. NB41Y]|uniref:head maturation protease, ClpP-related n=1 Tax=Gordonia sp. NB41Y TaxID=875808 RepID=UPI0002BEBE8D|nr:head maturation protease, ClpP-related [Gordonia sp. NB41Y]WLP90249.1 ATP-dependent Clp protease proteolytic subunit [Gordonia sp. NB41Y]